MKHQEFFAVNPVFTVDEFREAFDGSDLPNPRTLKATLAYYTRSGRLKRVRRGLYVAVPVGMSLEHVPVDPFLLAGKMADDAILSYHTALAFYGKAYSLQRTYYYGTRHATHPMTFQEATYVGVRFPGVLATRHQQAYGLETVERSGVDIRVTSLERTFVDVLDRPGYGGGWEEIWRSLDMIEYLDLDQVLAYAILLGNATTIAKVGWFLEQHREAWMVPEHHLDRLAARRPTQPHYLDRGRRESSRLVPRWNLLVPQSLFDRSWEEPV